MYFLNCRFFSIISTSKSDEELIIDENFDGKQRPERISVICANPQWKKEERMSRDEMNFRLSGLQTMEILLEIEKVGKKYPGRDYLTLKCLTLEIFET